MIINQVTDLSLDGMIKISPDEGSAFFLRREYLPSIEFERIYAGAEFNSEEEISELLDAGLAAAVEFKALSYLARCEQCHFNLAIKLQKKGFQRKYIEMALLYLEQKNYLNDKRFASAWLYSRALNHYEGKSKLICELLNRGIDKEICEEVVTEFFLEKDEVEIAKKAYEKYKKKGKEGEKLIQAMLQSGFSYKIIKNIVY